MRRIVFFILCAVLLALVIARSLLPEPAQYVLAETGSLGWNVMSQDVTARPETAGSGLVTELDRYFLLRKPTAKSAWTGALRGRNLVLVCADAWAPEEGGEGPELSRLARESVPVADFWLPDWFQGADGREFALLSGLLPTRVEDTTALRYAGERDVYLPFALARCLAAEGYGTWAGLAPGDDLAAFAALGFLHARTVTGPAADAAASALAACGEGPFFLFLHWTEADGEPALAALMAELRDRDLWEDTVLCLVAGGGEGRGRLLLRAAGLSGAACAAPCSDLDVTPTLLNLFGAEFDSRLLSGRDILAGDGDPDAPSARTPLVSLYGSAWSDWITDAGRFTAADRSFVPAEDRLPREADRAAYVRAVCALQYDRYIFARRALECDYFRLLFP